MIMKKKILILGAVLTAVLGGTGIAEAAPGNTPHPTPTLGQTGKAGSELLDACKAFQALYTPIPVGAPTPVDDPATAAVNEANATVYVFADKATCKATVNAGKPIGLLSGLPATTISVVAPTVVTPPPATVTPPALAVLANVVNGSATAPFTFNVVGTGFTASSDVSALVTYKDGHVVVVAVGKTDAAGKITYPVAGACVGSQQPVSVALLQFPAGPAATAAVPAGICPA
jgi:hypothetical protein